MPAVRKERTGWRDQDISARHRTWGFDCPAVDLDFLVVEYNVGLPVALIEYKHHFAGVQNFKHPTYRALADLANGHRDPLPFIVAFYWPEIWAFRVRPLNKVAAQHMKPNEVLTERGFVSKLYQMRRLVLAKELEGKLLNILPEEGAGNVVR